MPWYRSSDFPRLSSAVNVSLPRRAVERRNLIISLAY
jgi:hypothetical protein